MSLYGRPVSAEEFSHHETLHPCPCGETFVRVGSTTMLACYECGEVRWLVPSTPPSKMNQTRS